MNTLILSGVSSEIDPPAGLGVMVKGVDLLGIGSSVVLSGNVNGIMLTTSGDFDADILFSKGETVTAIGSAGIVKYIYTGDQQCAMVSRSTLQARPTPWRFR